MLLLTIRTDKPEAEVGLYADSEQLAYLSWSAHRQLAETIHAEISQLLAAHQKNWSDLRGIAVFRGPGSFTGLRIGIAVANALAASLGIPMVGTDGENWLSEGLQLLVAGDNQVLVSPVYGSEPKTTQATK